MHLTPPYKGMTHIWNVSSQVGVRGDSQNRPDDVELVQRLLIERYKIKPSKIPRAAGIGHIGSASGHMDTQTGFEIYWAGLMTAPLKDAETISPARNGQISYGSGVWTIAYLNWVLFSTARQVWENFPNLCSPQLKQALLTKTIP